MRYPIESRDDEAARQTAEAMRVVEAFELQ